MDSVFLKIWIFSPHPFNCKKLGRVELSSNFLLLLSLTAFVITLTCEIWAPFFKSIHQKWKYYREEKQDFERLLIFLNIKMSAKSNKIELSEEFMAMWREEMTLWDVLFPLYPGKNEKGKSLNRMSDKAHIFQTDISEQRSISNAKSFFSLPRRSLNFSNVFKLALKLHWLVDTQRRYNCLYDALS